MKNNVKIVVYLCLLPVMLFCQEATPKGIDSLHIAYDEYLFSAVKRNDAVAALNLWTKTFSKELEVQTNIKSVLSLNYIGNMNETLRISPSTNYDLVVVLSTDYVLNADRNYWIPAAVSADEGHIPEEYLLLVREGSGLTDLKQLQGKSIAILKGPDSRFSRMWLQNLTLQNCKLPAGMFFKRIEEEDKISKAVLDVFFNKTDACVVGYNAFQTMTELNPQLKMKLIILRTSPSFIKGLICIRKDYNSGVHTNLVNAVLKLGDSESGSQVLRLFGESLILPYEPRFLSNIEQLVSDNQKLMGLNK